MMDVYSSRWTIEEFNNWRKSSTSEVPSYGHLRSRIGSWIQLKSLAVRQNNFCKELEKKLVSENEGL